MIFGFGKGKKKVEEEDDDEIELITFQGALNGKSANLKANPGLTRAGLVPAKEIISDAISRRAYTIRLEPKGERSVIYFLVDGMPFPGPRVPKQQGLAMTQIMKLLAGLNIQVRDKNQKGGIKAELGGLPYEVDVEVTPGPGGERLVIGIDNLKTRPEKPDDLGIPENIREKIRDYSRARSGLLLACGGSRSGVTSSAVGLFRSLDAYTFNLYSIYTPGTRELPYVTEFEWLEGDDMGTTIARCQRVEADVIFCPPMSSADDAKTLFEHGSNSVLVTEFPARDTVAGLQQLLKWAGDKAVVAEQLKGILSQKLIRRLCPDCKQAYAPNPKLVAKIGLDKSIKALYRQRVQPQQLARGEEWEPCDRCGDLGYYGQTAMYEFLEMTEGMKEVVQGDPTPDAIRARMKADGMTVLQQDGLRLVAEGITSLEELQRVFKS